MPQVLPLVLPQVVIELPFRKMNGIGNDFVILDRRKTTFEISCDAARAIANRKTGIGCDQLIILEASTRADVFMRIINADGGEVDACGNATRCVGRLMMDEFGSAQASIETSAGLLFASDGGDWHQVTVDMGRPNFAPTQIPLSGVFEDTRAVPLDTSALGANLPPTFAAANMGNPHAIFWVDDVEAHELGRIGPILEHHPIFPERANISLVQVQSTSHLIQKVWERGTGLTIACGTGACAAAVSAMRAGLTGRKVSVTLPGGDLVIEWRADGHVMMSGPVALEFDGVIGKNLLLQSEKLHEEKIVDMKFAGSKFAGLST